MGSYGDNKYIISAMQTTFALPTRINITEKMAKPFLKWAGGKGQLIQELVNYFPPEMNAGKISKYAEPFIGGGALFFFVAQNILSIETFFISDVNEELILAYKTIQKDVECLISLLAALEKAYNSLDRPKQKNFFYQKRADFNKKLADIDFKNFHLN